VKNEPTQLSGPPSSALPNASFLAGTVSGTTKCLVGHPFDTIKTRLQTNPAFAGPWECLTKTLKREGVKGLYKVCFVDVGVVLDGWGLMVGVDATACGVGVYGFCYVGEFTYVSTVDEDCFPRGEIVFIWSWLCGRYGWVYCQFCRLSD
jgi:hypothetical protein